MTGIHFGCKSFQILSRFACALTLLLASFAAVAQSATATSGTQIVVNLGPPAAWSSQAEIYRNYALVATVSASTTSWTDNGLANGTTYSYYVRWMWWGECCWESSNTALFYATTWSAPAAPSGLGATLASATQFNLAWTDTSGNESGFKIERKTGAGGTYAQIGTTDTDVASFSDPTVTAGVTYYYRVRATNAVGNSAYSAEAAAVPALPSAPISLNAAAFGQTQVNLTWADVGSNETGYKVERKTGSGGTYAQVGTTGPNATYYIDSAGIAAGNTYFYRVRGTNDGGDSPFTSEAIASTTSSPPPGSGSTTVDYTYDAFGNLVQTNAGGVITSLSYDLRGRKTAMSDADMGSWSYSYNALGELVSQTDAKGQASTMVHDKLGRLTSRTEPDLVSNWTYDSCTKGVGKLCQATSDNGYQRAVAYDGLGRPASSTTTVDTAYTVTTNYDSAGRVEVIGYPTGFATKYVYNSYGYLAEVRNNGDNSLYWQAQAIDASGGVTQEGLGNSLTVNRAFDLVSRLEGITAAGSGGTVQSLSYEYDAIGNVTQRTDSVMGVTENFAYDSLNRLLSATGPGLVSRTFDYDAIGNITYKSDVGNYAYPGVGSARPHAVSSVGNSGTANSITATYAYDPNGSLVTTSGTIYPASGSVAFSRTLTYTSFNMPTEIEQLQGGSTYRYTYTYNAEHQRVRLLTERPDDTLTSIYLHPNGKGSLLYEKETRQSDGRIEHKHYVNAGGALLGVFVTKSSYASGESPEMRYYHRDHLGSVAVITNSSGAVLERLSYEAFGERRHPNGTPQNRSGPLFGITTDRGYTAHEHLDELNLIHMNGRIYDPALARFMTSDPFVDGATNLQSYNRYAYVNNHPLAYSDPSGYFKLKNFLKASIKLHKNPFKIENHYNLIHNLPGQQQAEKFMQKYEWARALGHVAANYFGGPLGGAFVSGYEVWLAGGSHSDIAKAWGISIGTAYAMNAVGGAYKTGTVGNVVGHAVVGCASAEASGGDCGSGALAAGFSAAATSSATFGAFGNTVFLATVGGTASVIGGGKFSNGAVTAAMGYLFNQLAHERRRNGPGGVPCFTCSASTSVSGDSDADRQLGLNQTRIHGNSGNSMGGTEVYYLINRTTGVIDKIGITSDAAGRYSQAYLAVENVRYETQTQYTWRYAAMVDENIRLTFYRIEHGELPRLNKVTR